jgi:hypothetical protein
LFGLSECTNQLFDFLQVLSFLVYINNDLPSYFEIFLISSTYFQNNVFPSIGEYYYESTDQGAAYHQYFSHIIIDQNPYEIISDRLGYSSSYIINGSGLLYFSLLLQLICYCLSNFQLFLKYPKVQ